MADPIVQLNIPSTIPEATAAIPAPIKLNIPSTDQGAIIGSPDTNQSQSQEQDPTSQPGWFHSALQDIAKPLARANATLTKLNYQAKDLSHSLFGTTNLTDAQKQELTSNTYDEGYFGKVSSFQNPWDAAGAGAEIASYMLPIGEIGAGVKVAAKIGEDTAKSGFDMLWSGAKSLFMKAAPFAATQALGTGLEDTGQGKSAADTIKDTIAVGTGTALGFMAFGAGGNLLKTFAGRLLKNEAVQAASKQVVALTNRMLNLDPAFGETGDVSPKVMAANVKALQAQAVQANKDLVDAVAEAIKVPDIDASKVMGAATDGVMNAAKTAQASAASQYGSVMSEKIPIGIDSTAPVQDALQKAMNFIKKTPELRNAEDTGLNLGADAKALNPGLDLSGGEHGVMREYISKVQEALGTKDNPKTVSMQTIDNLHMLGMNAHPDIPQDGTYIKDIATSLYDSAKEVLSKHPETIVSMPDGSTKTYGEISKDWTSARQSWLNFNSIIGDKFSNDIKGIGNPAEFAESTFKSKIPSISTQNAINSMSRGVKSSMGDLLYNHIIDESRRATSYANGGKDLTAWLDGWANTGILKPEQISGLHGLAEMMQSDYSDVQKNILKLTGQSTEAASPIIDHQAKTNLLTDITKSIGDRDLYSVKTENGKTTYDFTQLQSMLNKVNNPALDPIQKALDTVKDISDIGSGKLLPTLKAVFGGAAVLAGHPWIGGSLFLRNIAKVLGKETDKMTGNDLANFTANLAKNGKLSSGLFADIISGKFEMVENALSKIGGRGMGNATKGVARLVKPDQQ